MRDWRARPWRCGAAAIFDPYHRRIDEIIDQRLHEGRPTVLLSLHSFTPVYAGIARPWHIGTLYHRDRTLPPLLLKALRGEADLVVGDNEPYAVSDETDYTVPVHGEMRGLLNTGIEIRQDLISDQAGEKDWADRLARILGEIEIVLHAERVDLTRPRQREPDAAADHEAAGNARHQPRPTASRRISALVPRAAHRSRR